MVEEQILSRGITDTNIIEAFKQIPRHLFIPEKYLSDAYRDGPIPIGEGQTISQPFMVAEMTLLLDVKQGDKILEIGTGSGYQAAILAFLGAEVYSIERINPLRENAEKVLKQLSLDVHIAAGDGTCGLVGNALYNSIIVTAAAPDVPSVLMEQLVDNGRLVIPVGSRMIQVLKVYKKTNNGIKESDHGGCVFVPLLGKYGWHS